MENGSQKDSKQSPPVESRRGYAVSLWTCWLIVFGVLSWLEFRRFQLALESEAGAAAWLVVWDIETTLPFLAMFSIPLVWFLGRPARGARTETAEHRGAELGLQLSGAALIFVLSLGASWCVGRWPVDVSAGLQKDSIAFSDLPPAYHDEYSYRLQARTFLDGRLSYPAMTVRPDLFHQMHVLNQPRTISRYFPLTGAWMAPFEAIGHPVWGQWLAGAFAAAFFYGCLLNIADIGAAIFGGCLIALSPGIAVFSNLLLSHHPTMLALSIFTFAFFRLMKTGYVGWGFVAATGLSAAMLGRPMTAAGFAFPFGLWLLAHVVKTQRWSFILAFVLPLAAGFGVLAVFNHAATGSYVRTAYQEYTDTYTPSHRYGFNNVVDADQRGEHVLTAYDDWATNLTPQVAVENVKRRLFYSAQWALAIFPLLFGVLMAVPVVVRHCRDDTSDAGRRFGPLLLLCAVVTMHLAHVPYWFDGIMHWHYVFETGPLLLMLSGLGYMHATSVLQTKTSRPMAMFCCVLIVASGLVPAWGRLPFCDDVSKVSAAVSELSYARKRFYLFHASVSGPGIQHPALVLVDERGSDPQLSYVTNDPELKGDVIICRYPQTDAEIAELRNAFPGRSIYRFSPQEMTFSEIAD